MNIQIIVVCKECGFRMEQTNIDFDNSVLVTVKPCVNGCGLTPRALDDAEVCDCGEPFPENGKCKFCGARARHRQ